MLSLPEGGWKDTERVQRLVDGIRQSEAIREAMQEARQAVEPPSWPWTKRPTRLKKKRWKTWLDLLSTGK